MSMYFTCIYIVSILICRSGRYVLNTSSDSEPLLESPAQSPQQSTVSVCLLRIIVVIYCINVPVHVYTFKTEHYFVHAEDTMLENGDLSIIQPWAYIHVHVHV